MGRDAQETNGRPWLRWTLAAGYAVLLIAIIAALLAVRHRVLAPDRRAAAQAAWETWRRDVEAARKAGKTRRRLPPSDEPPAVVLLRDYFLTCTIIALVLASAVYGSFAFFVTGAARSGRPTEPLAGCIDSGDGET